MSVNISSQAYIFFYSVIGGVLIAFIYDLFRVKRRTIKTSGAVIYIEDFIYWILVAIVFFSVVYYSNEGEPRGFIFVGAGIGVVLYILLFSRFVVKTCLLLIKVVRKVFISLWRIFMYPLRVIFVILRVPATFVFKIIRRLVIIVRLMGQRSINRAFFLCRLFRNIRKKV